MHYSFLWKSKLSTLSADAVLASGPMLSFGPQLVIQAITFHLLDEGKANVVNLKASEAAVIKLAQRIDHLAISAGEWAIMSNAQRLQWLMDHSHVAVKVAASGCASLSVRG